MKLKCRCEGKQKRIRIRIGFKCPSRVLGGKFIDLYQCVQMWQNFATLAMILSLWEIFWIAYLVFGKLLYQLWHFYTARQIVIVVKGQRYYSNIAIWSHCTQTTSHVSDQQQQIFFICKHFQFKALSVRNLFFIYLGSVLKHTMHRFRHQIFFIF